MSDIYRFVHKLKFEEHFISFYAIFYCNSALTAFNVIQKTSFGILIHHILYLSGYNYPNSLSLFWDFPRFNRASASSMSSPKLVACWPSAMSYHDSRHFVLHLFVILKDYTSFGRMSQVSIILHLGRRSC